MSVMGIFTNNALGCQLSLSGELQLALLVRRPATKTDGDTAGNPCWAGDFIELTVVRLSVQVYAPRGQR